MIIKNATRPLLAPLEVERAGTFFRRAFGLMFRRSLGASTGLLLVETKESVALASIHMMFVFMDLGIVWIDAWGAVVDRALAHPFELNRAPARPAKYTLEIHPARLDEFSLGDVVVFE